MYGANSRVNSKPFPLAFSSPRLKASKRRISPTAMKARERNQHGDKASNTIIVIKGITFYARHTTQTQLWDNSPYLQNDCSKPSNQNIPQHILCTPPNSDSLVKLQNTRQNGDLISIPSQSQLTTLPKAIPGFSSLTRALLALE